jgi:hypothetical protein
VKLSGTEAKQNKIKMRDLAYAVAKNKQMDGQMIFNRMPR